MSDPPLDVEWLPGRFAVCRFEAGSPIPDWATPRDGAFFSVTGTDEELSVVVPERCIPAGVPTNDGWVALRVIGPLDFSLIGTLARLAQALADAGISLLAISTHDTDILLVKASERSAAQSALARVARFRSSPA